jgi:hypothetical protein
VLCSIVPLRSTQFQDEIQRQEARLATLRVDFVPWDSERLSEQLKNLPDLVDDFFGRAWVEAFNGPQGIASLGARLSGADVYRLRSRLSELYSTLFDRHDPGLPGPVARRVSYRERYVAPDVSEHRFILSEIPPEPPSPQSAKEIAPNQAHGSPSPTSIEFRREHPISRREFRIESRQPLLEWLPKAERTIVLGEPGIGKSALLRFITLSLLDPDGPDPFLAAAWGERLPVWLSFNAWTRALALNEATNLEDFLFTWLHQHSADDLRLLLTTSLQDQRVLLLIDGLDEQYNKPAADVALDRLDAFLSGRSIPVVLTSRPAGYERIRRPAGEWRHGRLMDFGLEQIRALAKYWFSWLSLPADAADAAALATAQSAAQAEVERFIVELQATPRVLDLARVPLLLMLLIDLSRFGARLPDHRTKAYDKMVDLLLTVHPARRQRAAGATQPQLQISADDFKEGMARLALRIQESHGGGYAPVETCRAALVDYLSDQSEGPGYTRGEAWDKASQVIEDARTSLGLLVERGIDELGFIHLTIQEYLAAWAISRKSTPDQQALVAEHWRDPLWREVLLALVGIHGVVRRDRPRVEALVNSLRAQSRSALDHWRQWEILAEIVFSDLGLTPLRARPLAEDILDTIERSPFRNLNGRLARAAIRGLRAEHLREVLKARISLWFPARDAFSRARLIRQMESWPASDDLKAALTIAVRDEDVRCRIVAAEVLAKVFGGDPPLGQELLAEARRAVRPEVREACLVALTKGWPTANGLAELTESALQDRCPGVQLSGALGRISLGLHTEHELDVLWALGGWSSSVSIWREDELVSGILTGWPRADAVKQKCLTGLRRTGRYRGFRGEFRPETAWRILVEGFPGDPDVAAILAEEIRTQEYPFSIGHQIWEYVAAHFKSHPALRDAISEYLQRHWRTHPIAHFGPEEACATITAPTEGLRDLVLRSFGEMTLLSRYWATVALTEGWPNDVRVQTFLREQLAGPIEVASEVVPAVQSLGLSVEEQKRHLLATIRNPEARRVWIAFSTLVKISTPQDPEILAVGLESLQTRRHVHDETEVKSILIEMFPSDERVIQLARELWEQQDTYAEFLARIYGNDPYFRPLFLAALRPAEVSVRTAVAEELGATYVPRDIAVPILKRFPHETDPSVRATAVLSLATHASRDNETTDWFIDVLRRELAALGSHYEERRACAVAGLLRLGRYDLLRDQRRHDGSPERFAYGLDPWRPNAPVVRECLRSWRALKDAFGDQLFDRFGGSRANFWEAAGPWADEFRAACMDLQSYLREVAGTSVGSNTLDAMARLLPRSDELRETCLVTLTTATPQREPGPNVSRILGTHFGGEEAVLVRAREILESSRRQFLVVDLYWRILLSFCYGWPDSLEIQEWLRKPREQWKGMPWHIALHFDRVAERPEWFLEDVVHCLETFADSEEVGDEEIPRALALWASSERNRGLLTPMLQSEYASDVATALGLLSQGVISQELQGKLEELFEVEINAIQRPSRTGLDLTSGQLRSVADIIFDAIGAARSHSI